MARKRMIDPNIWHDEKFIRLPLPSRLLFIGLISHADDEGYVTADRRSLLARILPDHSLRTAKIAGWLKPIEEQGMVQRYKADQGEEYLRLTNWHRHQRIDKPRPSDIAAKHLTLIDDGLRHDWRTTEVQPTNDRRTTDGQLSRDCPSTEPQPTQNPSSETKSSQESSVLIEENRIEGNIIKTEVPPKWKDLLEVLRSIDARNYRDLEFDQCWTDELDRLAGQFPRGPADVLEEARRMRNWLLSQFDTAKETREKDHQVRKRFLSWLERSNRKGAHIDGNEDQTNSRYASCYTT